MSSPIGYIFLKPLDKCVMIIINILKSSRISIEFVMRNTILALNDLFYHWPLYCLPFNTNLFLFRDIPWDPCYPAFVLLYLGVLPSFMSKMSWEFHHLLRILDTGDPSCHIRSFLGPHVVSNQRTDNWTMMCNFKTSSNPIALKSMVGRSFLDYWLLNHHSNIGRATQPIFWAHLSTNV